MTSGAISTSARSALSAALLVTGLPLFAHAQPAPRPPDTSAVSLLNRYLAGDHNSVVALLQDHTNFDTLLEELRRDGSGWIAAEGPAQQQRRELVAVTVALEAARIGAWRAWRVITRIPRPPDEAIPDAPGMPDVIHQHWQAPPLLVEWACDLIRQGRQPRQVERLWWLASLAVAERAQDYEFLVGDARPPDEYNTVVIQHVRQGQLRFLDEPRFKLAQGIAEERHAPDIARRVFENLKNDVDLRGEAAARLGVMAVNERQDDRALALFKEVDSLTRDAWVLYIARFSTAQIFRRRNRLPDAEREYRRALEAIPHAQSGSVALAALLVRDGRRQEATEIIESMLAANPTPDDPWRTYGSGDDRFWPQLIAQLRAEIRR